MHRMVVAAAPGPAAPALETLRGMLMALFQFSQRHPEHYNLMFIERSVPRIRAHYERFHFLVEMKQHIALTVDRCVAEGALPAGLDGMSAFRVLVAAVHGVSAIAISDRLGPGESAVALAHAAVSVALRGLAAGEPLTFRACHPPPCPFSNALADAALSGASSSASS